MQHYLPAPIGEIDAQGGETTETTETTKADKAAGISADEAAGKALALIRSQALLLTWQAQ